MNALLIAGILGTLAILSGIGFVLHERHEYTMPSEWLPITQGQIRDRAGIVKIMQSNEKWNYVDMVEIKGFDHVAVDGNDDRYVDMEVEYDGGRSKVVLVGYNCRSNGLFSRREVHELGK